MILQYMKNMKLPVGFVELGGGEHTVDCNIYIHNTQSSLNNTSDSSNHTCATFELIFDGILHRCHLMSTIPMQMQINLSIDKERLRYC